MESINKAFRNKIVLIGSICGTVIFGAACLKMWVIPELRRRRMQHSKAFADMVYQKRKEKECQGEKELL